MFADLHTHSVFSDGSMTPEQIVRDAVKNNVGVLALTDHDTLAGSLQIRQMCADNKIYCIPGVEISALDRRWSCHILAYGFDVYDAGFIDFISHTRFLLDEKSVKLIEAMQRDYTQISLRDYFEYIDNAGFGGWKALRYLADKRIVPSIKDGIKFYSQYDILDERSGFPSVASAAYRIKKAGGYAVLAHPGKLIDTTDTDYFRAEINRLTAYGLDGVECHHPSHSDAITRVCTDICKANNLLITSGSDCHGDFGSTRVGGMRIETDSLLLGRLLDN